MLNRERFDAVVIGSGIGGMTAAALLSRVWGKRVLVLEKHFELGGLTHVFRRGAFEWDVGLHYVGELEQGSLTRTIMDFVTGGRLAWQKMPHDFERFMYPGVTVVQPADAREFTDRLMAAFPAEGRAIRRYFRDTRRAARWHVRDFIARFVPRPVAAVIRLLNMPSRRLALTTTGRYLDALTGDRHLRAVLASQWGDYGVTPSESAFAIHALIVQHYAKGAWYPRGGSSRIARSMEQVIERGGGECRICQDVVEILVEDGQVTGVKAIDRSGPEPREVIFAAPLVISDAGARETFAHLVPAGAAPDSAKEMRQLPTGPSAVTLYVGLRESAETLGIKGENLWINEDFQHDGLGEQTQALLEGRPRRCYLSFPGMKSGESRNPTAEIIALVDPAAFASWEGQPWKRRDAAYYELKDRIAEALLALVEKHVPGFGRLVAYSELSTPLTLQSFTQRLAGSMYGVPATPQRFAARHLRPATSIRGLLLCGSDISSLGIIGAMMGGVAAASTAGSSRGFFQIVGNARAEARRKVSSGGETSEPAPTQPGKNDIVARLTARTPLTDTIFELEYAVDSGLSFAPGQYMRLRVAEDEWREYSIVACEAGRLVFIVQTSSGGPGSRYVLGLKSGEETVMHRPHGDFRLSAGDRPRTFVATGTGVAPFIPMLNELADRGSTAPVNVLFGCRGLAESFLARYTESIRGRLNLTVTTCASRESAGAGVFAGRVTALLGSMEDGNGDTEYYVSGNPDMVGEAARILRARGIEAIYRENY